MSEHDAANGTNGKTVHRDEWIDAACDRFEDRLLGGEAVPVDEFLRAEGLDPANADPTLVRELERLYAHYARPDATRTAPVAAESGGDSGVRPGAVLAGRYKLIERIGGGGMGDVWTARQLVPVRRVVAVKVIRDGRGGPAVLARFEAERQALAVMDHPNIAKVLDAGGTESGRPFFVMELVKGVPITRFCDERKLTPRQRLELFVPVCLAVQHAHQKGVIHRDLKPGNVLVALHDDRPVPVVIDFGIAKATGEPLTDRSLDTGFGAVVGTPEYMSPEQATFNQRDIDTRSDVYALGVLLYELLTGTTPVDRKSLADAMLLEVMRIVREVDAPRPSAKLSSSDTLSAIAADRGTEPKRLAKMYRGELDWVLLKALEKDRERRYQSASAFAADIRRHLADEVVEARPPTAGYRLRKFARRNRPQVIAGGLVFLALVAGVVGTALGLGEARRQWREAETARANEAARADGEKRANERAQADRREADGQRTAAVLAAAAETAAKKHETAARLRAVASRDRALDALDAMTSGVAGESVLTQPATTPEQRRFLTGALSYYRDLQREAGDDEPTRRRTARAAFRIGQIERVLGHPAVAEIAYVQAEHEFAALARDFPNGFTGYQSQRMEALTFLAGMFSDEGKLEAARTSFRAALAVAEQLLKEKPKDTGGRSQLAHIRHSLAVIDEKAGDRTLAERGFRAALKTREELLDESPKGASARADAAHSRVALGELLAEDGRAEDAGKLLSLARSELTALLEGDPDDHLFRNQLGHVHHAVGNCALQARDATAAEEAFRAALKVRAGLAREFPNNTLYQADLGVAHLQLATVLGNTGRPEPAEANYRDGLAVFERLVAKYPGVAEHHNKLALLLNNYAAFMFNAPGRKKDAEKLLRRAVKLFERQVELQPNVVRTAVELAAAAGTLGTVLTGDGRFKDAREVLDTAITALERVSKKAPNDPEVRTLLTGFSFDRAKVHDRLGDSADAVRDMDRAIELMPPAARPEFEATRCGYRIKSGDAAGGLAEAERASRSNKLSPEARFDLARAYSLASGKDADKSDQHAKRAVEMLRAAFAGERKGLADPKDDPDLAPLRDRADFKKMLAEIGDK